MQALPQAEADTVAIAAGVASARRFFYPEGTQPRPPAKY